jgi:hypothetical protein
LFHLCDDLCSFRQSGGGCHHKEEHRVERKTRH